MTHLQSHCHTKLGVFGTGCRPLVADAQCQPHCLQAFGISLLLIGVAAAFLFDSDHEFPLAGSGGSFFCVESPQSQAYHGQFSCLGQYLCAGTRLRLRRTPCKNVGKAALLVQRSGTRASASTARLLEHHANAQRLAAELRL
jgi:hypothetical protein